MVGVWSWIGINYGSAAYAEVDWIRIRSSIFSWYDNFSSFTITCLINNKGLALRERLFATIWFSISLSPKTENIYQLKSSEQITFIRTVNFGLIMFLWVYECKPLQEGSTSYNDTISQFKVLAIADQRNPQGPPDKRHPGNSLCNLRCRTIRQWMWKYDFKVADCVTSSRLMITGSFFPRYKSRRFPKISF